MVFEFVVDFISAVGETNFENTVTIFPNPVRQGEKVILIFGENVSLPDRVILREVNGKMIEEKLAFPFDIAGNLEWKMPKNSGVYLLEVQWKDKTRRLFRVLVL